MKTNDLRKAVCQKLKEVCDNVYYELADDNAMYPHIVYGFYDINNSDLSRNDIMIEIDVWDKSYSAVNVENMCDSIESIFNGLNSPKEHILPTFFIESRKSIPDDDKSIRHRLIRIVAQNYER